MERRGTDQSAATKSRNMGCITRGKRVSKIAHSTESNLIFLKQLANITGKEELNRIRLKAGLPTFRKFSRSFQDSD